jgi:hypothetical protein
MRLTTLRLVIDRPLHSRWVIEKDGKSPIVIDDPDLSVDTFPELATRLRSMTLGERKPFGLGATVRRER